MQAYWILPNRQQGDDILASDGGKIVPLRRILEPQLRPDGFSHGVPAEILEKCAPPQLAQVLFAQRFPDWNGGKQLFSVTTPAGVDSSGRVVHLGVLFMLEPQEAPSFDLPCAGLSEQDQAYARALSRRLTSPQRGDSWAQSVRELSELPSRRGAATNVELERSVARFYSLYMLAPGGGLTRKPLWARSRARSTLLLILLATLTIWLAERACQHPLRASAWSAVER
jgi:hypothetical protein